MNLSDWRTHGEYFEFEKQQIFYRRSQKNVDEMTLLIHGFPTSSFDYHKIWRELADCFPVLAYDLIGYGFSAKPARFDYTTFRQADVLQSLLAHLKIRKIHILAHDYGNTITLELLARAAEKSLEFEIESVCFLNGALFPETHRPVLAQKILISPIGFLFGRLISDRIFKRSLASIFGAETQPTEAELKDFVNVFKFNGGRRIAHKLIRYMTERVRYRERWTNALQAMTQPFLFINGSADKVSGKHLVERFREVVPHQKNIVELEKIGHFPHFETPSVVLENYLKFRRNNIPQR